MYKNFIIAACDKNGLIGINNKMPWHLPEDLKHFRNLTVNNTVIMGKKTFESIGTVLDDRINIIISSTLNKDVEQNNLYIVRSIEEALEKAALFDNDNYIIGGGKIYQQFLDLKKVDEIKLTIVKKEYPKGDTYFPYNDIVSTTKYGKWSLDGIVNTKKCQFCTYSKLN